MGNRLTDQGLICSNECVGLVCHGELKGKAFDLLYQSIFIPILSLEVFWAQPMDGCIDGCLCGWMDAWMDAQTLNFNDNLVLSIVIFMILMHYLQKPTKTI